MLGFSSSLLSAALAGPRWLTEVTNGIWTDQAMAFCSKIFLLGLTEASTLGGAVQTKLLNTPS